MSVDLILSSQTSYFSRVNFKKFKKYYHCDSLGKLDPFHQNTPIRRVKNYKSPTYIILQNSYINKMGLEENVQHQESSLQSQITLFSHFEDFHKI